MAKVPEFYSVNEASKPAAIRFHHDNDLCVPGLHIPANERRDGTGNYRLCDDCKNLNDLIRFVLSLSR